MSFLIPFFMHFFFALFWHFIIAVDKGKSLKIICDKGRFKPSIPQKRPAKYTNYCYKAKKKKPESALNKALSGKTEIIR